MAVASSPTVSVCVCSSCRVEDVKRAVTRVAVKEARLAEIKQELLNSERLQQHFQQNPHEFQVLRHDKGLLPSHRVHEHLKHVPDYLLPEVSHSLSAVDVDMHAMRIASRHVYAMSLCRTAQLSSSHPISCVNMCGRVRQGMRVGRDPSARKKKRRRGGKKRAVGQGADRQRRKDNDPLQSFGGGEEAEEEQQPAQPQGGEAVDHEAGMHDEEDDEDDDGGGGEEGGDGEDGDRIYQSTEGLGESTAGRVLWKRLHKKGKWNKYGGKKPEKKKFARRF